MQTTTNQTTGSANASTHNVPSRTNTRTSSSSSTATGSAAIPANAAPSPVLVSSQAATPTSAPVPSPSHASSRPPSIYRSTSQSNASTRPTSPSSPSTTQQPQRVQASMTPTPTNSIPSVANGAATAAPISTSTTVTPAKLGSWHRLSSSRRTRCFRDCKYLMLATIIYALALGTTLTAKSKYTLLGAVPFGFGLFFLTLISKSGDIALALAVNEVLDNMLWGRIARKDAMPMRKVLAMNTSTGLHGLWAMIRPSRESRAMGRSRYWAILHLLAVLLVPGPGLLLMAYVNPELLYFSTDVTIADTSINGTFDVSAGIATFQPAAAVMFSSAARFEVSNLAEDLLQNTNRAVTVKPISQECLGAGNNCSSSILSGGLLNMKPWPNLREDTRAKFMIVDDVSSYQFDIWPVEQSTPINPNQLCTVYGMTDPRFELCIDDSVGVEGRLRISARTCPYNFTSILEPRPDLSICGSDSNEDNRLGLDFQPLRLNLQVWNRTASHIMSTQDGGIRALSELGVPQTVLLRASDLFSALDLLLWPSHLNITNPAALVQNNAAMQLGSTTLLGLSLQARIPLQTTRIGQARAGPQLLCNIVLMPLYMFHSLYMGQDTQLGEATRSSLDSPQQGLGDAFYVKATYAYDSTRPAPAFWSILAYAGLGGSILLAVFVAQVCTLVWYPEADTSPYPLLDLGLHLKVLRTDATDPLAAPDEHIELSFPNSTPAQRILRDTGGLQIIARDAPP